MDHVKKVVDDCGHSTDQLDGVDLKEGEGVYLLWPDTADIEPYTVHVDHRRRDKDKLAFVVAPVRGTTNRVYLRWQKTVLVSRA